MNEVIVYAQPVRWYACADGVYRRNQRVRRTLRRYLLPAPTGACVPLPTLPPIYGEQRAAQATLRETERLDYVSEMYVLACAQFHYPYSSARTVRYAAQLGKRVMNEVAACFVGA